MNKEFKKFIEVIKSLDEADREVITRAFGVVFVDKAELVSKFSLLLKKTLENFLGKLSVEEFQKIIEDSGIYIDNQLKMLQHAIVLGEGVVQKVMGESLEN